MDLNSLSSVYYPKVNTFNNIIGNPTVNNVFAGQNYLKQAPACDTVTFSGSENKKEKKNNSAIALVIGGIVAVVGIVAAYRLHKANVGKEAAKGAENLNTKLSDLEAQKAELDKKLSAQNAQRESILNESRKSTELNNKKEAEYEETMKKLNEEYEKRKAEYEKVSKKLDEQSEKLKEKNEKIWEEIFKNVKQQKENQKDFEEKLKTFWEKYYKQSDENWKKYNEEARKNWKNFGKEDFSSNNPLKSKAQNGLEVLKSFMKNSDGTTSEALSKLDNLDTLTEADLKKAHWALFKKYGTLMNSGTEQEKAEATNIMQKINPACDDIKAFLIPKH